MIQMKSVIIGALLIAAAQISLVAQRGGHGFPIEKMKDTLELTQDQVKQLELIRAESMELMQALRQDESLSRDSLRVKMRELHAASRQKTEDVLTADQRSRLAQMRQERAPGFERKGSDTGNFRKEGLKDRRNRMKEGRAEARAYREEHILPVMLGQRAKLEEMLSVADKEKIASLRISMEKQREEMRLQRQSMRKQGEMPDKDAMKEMREAHRNSEEMQEAQALAEKYKEEIQGLLDEVKEQRDKWRSDIREIMKPGSDERPGKHGDRRHPSARGKQGVKHHGDRGERPSMDERKAMRANSEHVRFLLLDQNNTTGRTGAGPGAGPISGVEVFPNPATNVVNLSFNLKFAVRARIELRDESGNLVKDIPYQDFKEGEVSARIDLEGVPTGVYSIAILPVRGRQQVARVVVNK